MEKYKPGYLGKVLPADDPSKLTDFVNNKYDAFSRIYDTCKDQSENIADIKAVETGSTDPETLSIKISASEEAIDSIKESTNGNESVTIDNDVITARS